MRTSTRSGVTRTLYFDKKASCFMYLVKKGNIVTPIKLPRNVYDEDAALKLARKTERERGLA